MLLLNRKGEQIVSIALPIRRFSDVQGVLLLSTRPGQIDKILREERIVILVLRRYRAAGLGGHLAAAGAHRCRPDPPPVGRRRARQPQHRGPHAAAGILRAAPTRWRRWRTPSTP